MSRIVLTLSLFYSISFMQIRICSIFLLVYASTDPESLKGRYLSWNYIGISGMAG